MEAKDFPAGGLPGSVLIDNDVYHADTTRISSSGVKLIGQSPAHYYSGYLDPLKVRKNTDALTSGSIIHSMVLERDKFEKEYYPIPDDAPKQPTKAQLNAAKPSDETKKLIDWWAEFDNKRQGRIICSKKDMEMASRMADSVERNRTASELLNKEDIEVEQAFLYDDPNTGARCKIKPDATNKKYKLISDLKSCQDASRFEFGKDAANYHYPLSGTMYLDGAFAASGVQYEGFVFIAVEKAPPYAIGCYVLPQRAIDNAREELYRNLETYQKCIRLGVWPAYPEGVSELVLPNWHYKIKADSFI